MEVNDLKNKFLQDSVNDNDISDLLYYLIFIKNYGDEKNNILNTDTFLTSVLGKDYKNIRKLLNFYYKDRNNFFICDLATVNDFDFIYLMSMTDINDFMHSKYAVVLNFYNLMIDKITLEAENILKQELFPYTYVNNFNYNNLTNNDLNYLIKYNKLYPEYFKVFRESSKEFLENINEEKNNYSKIKTK